RQDAGDDRRVPRLEADDHHRDHGIVRRIARRPRAHRQRTRDDEVRAAVWDVPRAWRRDCRDRRPRAPRLVPGLPVTPRRSSIVATARAANAAFLLTAAAYAFLVASPFAYEQFIKPSVVPALTDFVRLSPLLFLLMWLAALFTLLPYLSSAHRSISAIGFLAP